MDPVIPVIVLIALLSGSLLGYWFCLLRFRRDSLPTFVWKRIFDSAPYSAIVLDKHGHTQYWNQAMMHGLGRSYTEAVGQRPADIFTSEQTKLAEEAIAAVLAGLPYEEGAAAGQAPNQTIGSRQVYYWPERAPHKAVNNVVVTVHSMAALHQRYLDALRDATILASLRDAIFTTDSEWRIVYWNRGAELLLGITADSAVGQPLSSLGLLTQNDLLTIVSASVQQVGTWCSTPKRCDKNGTEKSIALTIYGHNGSNGHLLGYIGVARDVTQERQAEHVLREKEQRFHSMADGVPTMIWMGDDQQKSVFVNKTWLEFAGLTLEETLGDSWLQCIHPADVSDALSVYNSTFVTRSPFAVEYRMRRHDGVYRWVLDQGVPRYTPEGQFAGYIGNMLDITERKHAQQTLKEQNALLTALTDTTLALLNRLNVEDLLQDILTRAANLVGTPHGCIYLSSEDGLKNRITLGVGFYRNVIGLEIPSNAGLSGKIWQTGQATSLENYAIWPERLVNPIFDVIHAMMGVPLISGGKVAGVLLLSRIEDKRAFTEDELAVLRRFAELTSVALDNARLYSAAQSQLQERERAEKKLLQQNEYLSALNETTLALLNHLDVTDLLEDILKHAETLVGTEHGCIYLIEPGHNVMSLKISTGMFRQFAGYLLEPDDDSGVTGKAWITGQAVAINNYSAWEDRNPTLDFADIRAAFAVPFTYNGQVMGILAMSHLSDDREFSADDIEMLTRFSELAAIALDNAQLYSAAQDELIERTRAEAKLVQQNGFLKALNETTLALNNRQDVNEILEAILQRLCMLIDAPGAFVDLIYLEETATSPQLTFGPVPLSSFRVPYGEGIGGRVWATGQPLVVEDYSNWPGRVAIDDFSSFRATLAVPLKSDDRVIGVLGLVHVESGRLFSDEDVTVASRFAELASISLDNTRLYRAAQQELAERKRAEEELRQMNAELEQRVRARTAELQTLLDDMGEGMLYSQDSRIRYANRALAELTYYELPDLIGQPISVLFGETDSYEPTRLFDAGGTNTGATWRGEISVRRRDGSQISAALVVTPVTQPDTEQQGTIAVVRDVTREKQLQAQKARFIANASHELRTPLASFKTRLYLVKRQPERLDDHLAMLERVTDRMTRLVEDLLDVTRFERGVIPLRRESVVLQTLLEDAVQVQQPEADRKGILLNKRWPVKPVRVYADPNRMAQVITNLLVNAINYTPTGGHIDVELQVEDVPQSHVIIRVCDTGIGISPEHLPKVFEPFFRASEGDNRGTGLGLSISKEIVELHGGVLDVDSNIGVGSKFSVRLPLTLPYAINR